MVGHRELKTSRSRGVSFLDDGADADEQLGRGDIPAALGGDHLLEVPAELRSIHAGTASAQVLLYLRMKLARELTVEHPLDLLERF
jgi:hypothetical protein